MFNFALTSELAIFAGTTLTMFYALLRRRNPAPAVAPFAADDEAATQHLLRLQTNYGYNPHSLVGISKNVQKWFDFNTQSGLCYTQHRKIRLVAGELLGSEENCQIAVRRFVAEAQENNKLVAFLPTTEKFARAVVPLGFKAVKIGAAPYFDLQTWNPRGDKAKKMRAGTNQARKAGVTIEQMFQLDSSFGAEVSELCESWAKTRRAAVKFGWLFELEPFQHAAHKKFFAARNAQGKLVGLLAASPIPAREGWYLEDVLRYTNSPTGTTDLLIYETLKILASEGAKIATLGTVPLTGDGTDTLTTDSCPLLKRSLKFSCENLESIYNFRGLRHFKGKFVPSWWESEYLLLPEGFLVSPRVAHAFARALLPGGFLQLISHRLAAATF